MCLLLTTAPRIVVGVLLSVLTSLHKPTLTAGDGVLQALADPARCSATQQRLLMVRERCPSYMAIGYTTKTVRSDRDEAQQQTEPPRL